MHYTSFPPDCQKNSIELLPRAANRLSKPLVSYCSIQKACSGLPFLNKTNKQAYMFPKFDSTSKPPIRLDFGTILPMSTESATRTSMPPSIPRAAPLLQAFIALSAGLVLFLVLLVGSMVAFDMSNAGKILPGVSIAGIDLSGLTPEEASSQVSQGIAYPTEGRIAFQEGSNVWVAKPGELGLFLDPQTSALAAYEKGRQGDILARLSARFQAWYSGVDIPPLMVFDERIAQRYLKGIADEIDLQSWRLLYPSAGPKLSCAQVRSVVPWILMPLCRI
jgi:hypothetical protein